MADLPKAAELFGFRMGMTKAEVRDRVPQVLFGSVNEFGVSKTSINPDFDPRIDKASFAGVRTVSLDFLDDQLTSLWFGFDGSFKWKTVPEFVAGISKSLNLPHSWEEWRTRGQRLKCADFQMTVQFVAEGPSFRILDGAAIETIAARQAAKEELETAAEEAHAAAIIADAAARVYYLESCLPAQGVKEVNRVVFKTTDEADKAGYKLARSCRE